MIFSSITKYRVNQRLRNMQLIIGLFLLYFALLSSGYAQQRSRNKKAVSEVHYRETLYNALEWRNVGPFRGGRSATVTGVPGKPNLYYFGATGGGVWRTKDAGNTWENISDGFFGGSIGAVAVSDWDNNVIYVGGGEVTVRGNVSSGEGVWKSVDAGATWRFMGLKESKHIPRIRIHPKNPDIVYAAVLGDLYRSTTERGVYKSTDGGKTWQKKLYVNKDAGVVDLILDPENPRILYASTWRVRRTPYSLESGGEGSGLWKSADGGETWIALTGNKGLPKGTWGISGVTVSPAKPDRLWAIVENKDGGVYRSDDAGMTWTKTNDSRSLRQRAWYYSRIYADSKDEDKVYVMNVRYHRSKDGGKTFEAFNAPHGDHHDLWIAPEDPERMIIGDDGGAQVSFDGGENWSTYLNQPTAQFYRVTTDNHFPYRIYAAQQDNSAIRIAHRNTGSSIGPKDFESTAGGESAHIAVHPKNNDIVYGGSYDGFLTRHDHRTKATRAINVWPDNPMGHGAEGAKYRFQWNFPIFTSPHDPNKLYAASNHLHLSEDEGHSWKLISPDLTRNDSTKLGPSGGPITKDNTSVEYYCTIFAGAVSPYEKGLIWTGSDDGLLHLTRDDGENWAQVGPKEMPEWTMINSVEVDPFRKGGLYIAGTRYKLGDYRPYLYHTKDYGKTWKKITQGIPEGHFTRVIRADPKRQGLLYVGTEQGMYISFDDGHSWKPFQLNLPIVPITDLAIKNDNLIAATQGRSLWLIDDLTPLHQLNTTIASSDHHLFMPMPSYLMSGGSPKKLKSKTTGRNHPGGAMVHFYLKDTLSTDTVRLSFVDSEGELIRAFTNRVDKNDKKSQVGKLEVKPGMNRFVWNMRYPGAMGFEGMILWWASLRGPRIVPGTYRVKLDVNGKESEQSFEVLKDPRSDISQEELGQRLEFLMSVRDKLSEVNLTIKKIRTAGKQMQQLQSRLSEHEEENEIKETIKGVLEKMKRVEEALYQVKNKSGQDPLNFPIRLNNKLGHLNSLLSMGDYPPTTQDKAFFEQISSVIDTELKKIGEVFNKDVPDLNREIKRKEIDAIVLPSSIDKAQ